MWGKHLEAQREGTGWDAHGPIAILAQVMKEITWAMDEKLNIERQSGGKIHLVEGEDGLFDHLLRADLRKAMGIRSKSFQNRDEFEEAFEKGIDYEATVKIGREKYGKNKAGQDKEYVKSHPDVEDILLDEGRQKFGCETDRLKLTREERGALRSIQAGAVPTGHRLWKAGLRPAPMCLTCEKEKDDTIEHALWGCGNERIQARKKELTDKYGERTIQELPKCVRLCGLIPDLPELDEIFAEVATGETQEKTEAGQPRNLKRVM